MLDCYVGVFVLVFISWLWCSAWWYCCLIALGSFDSGFKLVLLPLGGVLGFGVRGFMLGLFLCLFVSCCASGCWAGFGMLFGWADCVAGCVHD